jgi:transposase-like protein
VELAEATASGRPRDEGLKAGRSAEDEGLIRELQQRNRELERANKILEKASAYFAQAELDRP